MRFLTEAECQSWVSTRVEHQDERGRPSRLAAHLHHVRFLLPQTPGQLTWLCQFISRCLSPRRSCLLWVTDWAIFPSSENWHLYYRLRQSYADHRLIDEAPGHFFLDFEDPDMTSFLLIGILSGWDMHLIPDLAYGGPGTAHGFVCHDEWIALSHREPATAAEWRTELQRAEYRLLPGEAA